MKLVSRKILHKTENQAVLLNVVNGAEARQAFEGLAARSKAADVEFEGVLVETMVQSSIELIVGITMDSQFGPVVLIGLGGVLVEVLQERAILVPPFSRVQASDAIESVRGLHVLLCGVRGRPASNVEALLDVVMRIGAVAEWLAGQLVELEVNPLMLGPGRDDAVCVDALVRLREK